MIWDPEWDGSAAPVTAGHGEKWERLNNWILVSWERFNARLAEQDELRESMGKQPLTGQEKARHIERFRSQLMGRYGSSGVDQRWEAERANRLEARTTDRARNQRNT